MSLAGFEPTALVFERGKTVRALARAATLVDGSKSYRNDTIGYLFSVCVPTSQPHSAVVTGSV